MVEKRFIDPPTDARLAREIEALLAVDPSPELLVRIRVSIAEALSPDVRVSSSHRKPRNLLSPGSTQFAMKLGIPAAIMAVALVLLVLRWSAHETPHNRVTAAEVQTQTETVNVTAAAPSRPREDTGRKPEETGELVTGFFPLLENQMPLDRGLLIRLTLPASAMRVVGLTVDDDHLSDPVQAEILVGQDDLARAIRFVIPN